MSSNSSVISDEDGEYSDWIEILNISDSTINLLEYCISDDIDIPSKWKFPEYFIAPNQYLILFCSGKDRNNEYLHTNFQINSAGEYLWLLDSTGQIIDHIDSVEIPNNISLGRSVEDISEWYFYSPSTPGLENTTSSYRSRSESPNFSQNSGFYSSTVLLNLTISLPEIPIYYTIDGSEPTINSLKYEETIQLDSTTVIRAKSFEDGLLPSKTITNTYLLNENSDLPIISLSTDPDNFFDDRIGIYVEGTRGSIGNCSTEPRNWNKDWERPIHIEFFERTGELGFSLDAGIKIHGGCSRKAPIKGLTVLAKGEYGSKSINYPVFPDLPFQEYQSIVLRNAGGDYNYTFLRDPILQSLTTYTDIENQAYRPAVVFLNGEYWGIHNIRERVNKYYLKQYFDIDEDNIDLLESSGTAKEGDAIHYNSMVRFIEKSDMTIDSNYNYIKSVLDVENYCSYLIYESFFVNLEWFPTNMKYWRSKTSDAKWRWILYDTDRGFGLYDKNVYNYNMFRIITDTLKPTSVIFNGLIKNQNFQNKFINTFADYSNTVFKDDFVISKIDSLKSLIENEIPRHISRWGIYGDTYDSWLNNVEDLKFFANNRLEPMRQHFVEQFQLDSTVMINLNAQNVDGGLIKINSIVTDSFPWNGVYFKSIPIKLKAIARPGFKFLRWTINDSLYVSGEEIEVSPENNITISAEFNNDLTGKESIVINEINYNSNNNINSGDWVELFNRSDSTIDLSNWIISDGNDDNEFIIPNNTYLNKYEYLIICNDSLSLNKIYPNVDNFISGMNFKFSSDGELVILYNKSSLLIDSVRYSPLFPWPTEANGEGKTLELFHPNEDNYLANNWGTSYILGGTPGSTNSGLIFKKLFINEFMAINDSNIADESNENEDWIEIFNKNDIPISLDNLYITDNLDNLNKYKLIPDSIYLIIDPVSFLLFWADQDLHQGFYHLGFKLSGSGESIGLSLDNGIEVLLIDSISYLNQYSNQSFGRFPDAYNRWEQFKNPTPRNYNSTLNNHIPFFSSKFKKEYLVESDTVITLNMWEYVEDVETPDSLLKYNFTSSSNSIAIDYTKKDGNLEIIVPFSENESEKLFMKIEDNEGLFINDTIKFLYPSITSLDNEDILPKAFSLSNNYPNPFNPSTKIKFGLPIECKVSLTIYNILGQLELLLVNQNLKAGYHEVEFNNSNYSSGIYIYRLQAGDFVETKKMILLK